jgi:DUF971 family protein
MTAPLQPISIQKIGTLLAIAWSDGREDYLPLAALRKACPCASCNGEPDVMGKPGAIVTDVSRAPEELTSWQMIGGYGFQPRWVDGHASGIFSFAYLRQLGERFAE